MVSLVSVSNNIRRHKKEIDFGAWSLERNDHIMGFDVAQQDTFERLETTGPGQAVLQLCHKMRYLTHFRVELARSLVGIFHSVALA